MLFAPEGRLFLGTYLMSANGSVPLDPGFLWLPCLLRLESQVGVIKEEHRGFSV